MVEIVALIVRHGGWLIVSIALISFSNATSGPFLFDGAYRISEWLHSCTHPLLLLCSSAHGTLFAGSDTLAITGNQDVDPSSDLADISDTISGTRVAPHVCLIDELARECLT